MSLEDLDPESEGLYKLWMERGLGEDGDFLTAWKRWQESHGKSYHEEMISAHEMLCWITQGDFMTEFDGERIVEWLDQEGNIGERQHLSLREIHPEAYAQ